MFKHKLPPARIVDRKDFILRMAKNKKVLHLGCVDAGLLDERIKTDTFFHQEIMKVAKETHCLDIDKNGIHKMSEMGINHLYIGNVEDRHLINSINDTFEVIIAGEIIEHLQNPGLFLRNIRKLISKDGNIILTTPNPYYYQYPFYTLFNLEAIHPDHKMMFSYNCISTLLRENGFVIENVYIHNKQKLNVKKTESLFLKTGKIILNLIDVIVVKLLLKKAPFLGCTLIIVAKIRGNGDNFE